MSPCPPLVRGQWANAPFPELQVGGDDHAGFLTEPADEVGQARAAGLWERNVTQLADDDAIQGCQLPDDLPSVSIRLLPDQSIDRIDRVEVSDVSACGSI
jgi:hypothetical protein